MKIHFYKYQSAGNDFVVMDNRNNVIDHEAPELTRFLCDRRFGIGADGTLFLQKHNGYDFEMVYYNADGKPSSMCGNGGRAIVAFAKRLGIIDHKTKFIAADGSHHAQINSAGNLISLQMRDVESIVMDGDAYVLDTGSPHYVKLVDGLKKIDVNKDGAGIRNNSTYRESGINVNFVERADDGFNVRTFERGVEAETYACGTGATAVALAMAMHNGKKGQISTRIKALGGDMWIHFDHSGDGFQNIYLEGNSVCVFEGDIEVDFEPNWDALL